VCSPSRKGTAACGWRLTSYLDLFLLSRLSFPLEESWSPRRRFAVELLVREERKVFDRVKNLFG